ncbi:MAG: cytochrome c5 family protein [Betaproteobacteria bacterium]|nr:MAG: cytochrome c5 family protein [Betaproteobacteria bacterium]
MAAPQNAEHIEEHKSFIQTPRQLITVVVLAFAVPVGVIVMLAVLVTSSGKYDAEHAAMDDEAIAQRIKPVGRVVLAEAAPATAAAAPAAAEPAGAPVPAAPAPTAAAAAPAAQAAAADGKAIYEKTCAVCHVAGVAGAPKAGDKAAWAPRLKQGMDMLYASSLKGKGAMPPKGGAAHLSDAEIKAAVDYLAGLAK